MATLIMNDATSIVHDALEGFVMMHPELALLDALEQDIKVVLRKDWDPACGKVALVSGGGSGHEPSHAGWVGRGMLTAAVCGDVFASPSVDAVTAAIHAVAGPGQGPDADGAATAPAPAGSAPGHPGVCLIIKNYGGDRLNFGLAAERARAAGIPTRTVVVADDCALKGAGATGRRGVAGTVLVHKVAGAVAEAGGSLEEVAAAAERAAAAVATLGVATSTCSVPGRPHDPRLDAVGTFEVGLGIHGEPGKAQVTGMTARDVAATCVDGIRERKAEDSPAWAAAAAEHGLVVLLNNLGGVAALHVSALAKDVAAEIDRAGWRVVRWVQGPLMTALDMRGVSVTLMPADESTLAALDAETQCAAWPGAQTPLAEPARTALPPSLTLSSSGEAAEAVEDGGSATIPLSATMRTMCSVLQGALMAAADSAASLNALDAVLADGDTGSTLRKGALAALALLSAVTGKAPPDATSELPEASLRFCSGPLASRAKAGPGQLLAALSTVCSRFMGGTLGILLALGVAAAGTAVLQGGGLPDALTAMCSAVQLHGGAQPGMCTLVDALHPAAAAMQGAVQGTKGAHALDLPAVLQAAADAAAAGAEGTGAMAVQLGRGVYATEGGAEAVRQTRDPGAVAIAVMLGGAAAAASASTGAGSAAAAEGGSV